MKTCLILSNTFKNALNQGCRSRRIFLLPLPAPYKVNRFRVCFRFQLLLSKCFRFQLLFSKCFRFRSYKNLTAFTSFPLFYEKCVRFRLLKKSNAFEFASTSSFFLQSSSASTKLKPLPFPNSAFTSTIHIPALNSKKSLVSNGKLIRILKWEFCRHWGKAIRQHRLVRQTVNVRVSYAEVWNSNPASTDQNWKSVATICYLFNMEEWNCLDTLSWNRPTLHQFVTPSKLNDKYNKSLFFMFLELTH